MEADGRLVSSINATLKYRLVTRSVILSLGSKTHWGPCVSYASEKLPLADNEHRKPHPYRYEIKHISYPQHMFEHRDAKPPISFELTPFTWIDQPQQLSDLLEKLRKAKEIAVDLEYHSLRSFTGFVCLMQISTREEDFVIDTLALREEMEELNEVFTDPSVVKVFHGAESDIVWLQQDFDIYIVNMFDTYHASRLLGQYCFWLT